MVVGLGLKLKGLNDERRKANNEGEGAGWFGVSVSCCFYFILFFPILIHVVLIFFFFLFCFHYLESTI